MSWQNNKTPTTDKSLVIYSKHCGAETEQPLRTWEIAAHPALAGRRSDPGKAGDLLYRPEEKGLTGKGWDAPPPPFPTNC